MDVETVVQLTHRGRRFTFRVEHDPPLASWNVECQGRVFASRLRVRGADEPQFFVALAEAAIKNGV
jgi:hypothetical protein